MNFVNGKCVFLLGQPGEWSERWREEGMKSSRGGVQYTILLTRGRRAMEHGKAENSFQRQLNSLASLALTGQHRRIGQDRVF